MYPIPPFDAVTQDVDAIATCPAGKRAVGGGGTVVEGRAGDPTVYEFSVELVGSQPANGGTGWQATGRYNNAPGVPGFALTVKATAICVTG